MSVWWPVVRESSNLHKWVIASASTKATVDSPHKAYILGIKKFSIDADLSTWGLIWEREMQKHTICFNLLTHYVPMTHSSSTYCMCFKSQWRIFELKTKARTYTAILAVTNDNSFKPFTATRAVLRLSLGCHFVSPGGTCNTQWSAELFAKLRAIEYTISYMTRNVTEPLSYKVRM